MTKWLLMVEANCADAAREAEFNDWYDKAHLPEILEIPGFVKATRYQHIEPLEGRAKFLATYEIETDDINSFVKAFNEYISKARAEGRVTKLLVSVSRGFYKQISSLSK